MCLALLFSSFNLQLDVYIIVTIHGNTSVTKCSTASIDWHACAIISKQKWLPDSIQQHLGMEATCSCG